jgi:hypothetical protein
MNEKQKNPFPGSVKCKKPRFSNRSGKTWDACEVIDVNGKMYEGWLDTSWGHYFYFRDHKHEWRKAKIIDFMFDTRSNKADFRPLPKNKEHSNDMRRIVQ